jgi:hypothetical protein
VSVVAFCGPSVPAVSSAAVKRDPGMQAWPTGDTGSVSRVKSIMHGRSYRVDGGCQICLSSSELPWDQEVPTVASGTH